MRVMLKEIKIPTATELIRNKFPNHDGIFVLRNIEEFMIEFAKLHVEACKKDIAEDYTYYLEGDEGSEHLNTVKYFKEAYPLENIK
jgi:predicted HD phosphohydrolase